MTGQKLNDTDIAVYDFIIAYKRKNDGNSPTIRDIGKGVHISSTSYIRYILEKLDSFGLITYRRSRSRGILVPGGRWTYEPIKAAR